MSQQVCVFDYDRSENILIVVPQGDVTEVRDSDIRDTYNNTYREITQDHVKHLLIDFSQLNYFGSTFVGILIRLAKKIRLDGGEAVLCNLSDHMKGMMKTLMLLENTKTDFFWVPFETREEAVQFLHEKNA
ncbi:MAG: STAS domain-containing protein [Planctomycetaceae bacterium]|nr:STAS domain-containing protein [Planctomycetaceae bacterium]